MNISTIGYYISFVSYAFLALLLMTSWRGSIKGALLVVVVIAISVWAFLAAHIHHPYDWYLSSSVPAEVLRDLTWFIFLFSLEPVRSSSKYLSKIIQVIIGCLLIAFFSIYFNLFDAQEILQFNGWNTKAIILILMIFPAIGLVLIEQLFRNTDKEGRRSIKYLVFGIAIVFIYDLLLYSVAYLYEGTGSDIWAARGYVNAAIVPMLAVAAVRNPGWTLDIFVSRHVIFHTTAIIGIGIYLIIIGATGYYIGIFGGNWGVLAQIVFLVLGVIILFTLIISSTLRSRIKVFINKHFYKNKYDYREEWVKITEALSGRANVAELKESFVKTIANTMESVGASLWLKQGNGFQCDYSWNIKCTEVIESENNSLVSFLKDRNWLIDIYEMEKSPDHYKGLSLPDYIKNIENAWLIAPMWYHDELIGYIILAKPRGTRGINWEDRDLINMVCNQAASYLTLLNATEELFNARQFEAFNRISSYVVHDLKNLSAQLALVVSNAKRYKDNPEFVDDAFTTVENAKNKLNKMLKQLRMGGKVESPKRVITLSQSIREAISLCRVRKPLPMLIDQDEDVQVLIDNDKLVNVLVHLIQNAQEATSDNGFVKIKVNNDDDSVVIELIDSGCGMNEEFIRNQLFQPFRTSKGNAGMGIGVYQSREYLLSQGGDILVDSTEGKGTTFTITLPLYKDGLNHEPYNESDV